MYLNCLARLVADYRSFPRVSLSSLRALKPSSLLKPQRRFSAAEQICVHLVYEDPPWFTYPTLSHLHPSSIVFISLTRDLILIGSIIGLFFYTSSASINPYLPRYSLRDPSSILSYLASPVREASRGNPTSVASTRFSSSWHKCGAWNDWGSRRQSSLSPSLSSLSASE